MLCWFGNYGGVGYIFMGQTPVYHHISDLDIID